MNQAAPILGTLFGIQRFSLHDGPGIRSLVFLKGCPLACEWCCNPEGLTRKSILLFDKNICVACQACHETCKSGVHRFGQRGQHEIRRQSCLACGACVQSCPTCALMLSGYEVTLKEAFSQVASDRIFYETSGGGVTLGGGEPTSQPDFALALLEKCKSNSFSTAVETCAYAEQEIFCALNEVTDYFLVDIKHADPKQHKVGTGCDNRLILDNLDWLLSHAKQVLVRVPVIPHFNDDEESIGAIANLLEPHSRNHRFGGVEFLAYHRLGLSKYDKLAIDYRGSLTQVVDPNRIQRFARIMAAHGIALASAR